MVVGVGDQLSLWKSDVGRRFDLGRGSQVVTEDNRPPYGLIAFSPDGRYVAYSRPTDEDGVWSLVLFDTTTASERILESRLEVHGDRTMISVARFSPDSRRIVFYRRLRADSVSSELMAVELASGQRVTLASQTFALSLHDCLWFTRSNHVAFCVAGDSIVSGRGTVESYESSTEARRQLGNVLEVVTAPDDSYLVFTTVDGESSSTRIRTGAGAPSAARRTPCAGR